MKKTIVRRVVQLSSIVLFIFLLRKTGMFPVSEKLPLDLYYRLDGLLAVSIGIAERNIIPFVLPGLLILLLIMFVGNFFCSWICPLGGLIDYLNLAAFRRRWRIVLLIPQWLRNTGFLILMLVILSALFSWLFSFPFIGFIFDPFVIMGQAAAGLKLWVCFFAVILMTGIVFPRLWCNCFCPLGRLYTLASKRLKIKSMVKKLTKRRHG
ncbi:MAG TPA: 4Fe-4S binding protein [bacterium]|nr:4Fe-4S binding protein [bacterium]